MGALVVFHHMVRARSNCKAIAPCGEKYGRYVFCEATLIAALLGNGFNMIWSR